MPTRNISLTQEQDDLIEKLVASGEYQNASEAMRDAIRALQQRRKEDELKLEHLREQIKVGFDAIERGEYTEVGAGDLKKFIAGLSPPRARKRRAR